MKENDSLSKPAILLLNGFTGNTMPYRGKDFLADRYNVYVFPNN